MSTMFEVPCPGCGRPMRVGADGDAECVPCDQRYHAGMGHLFAQVEQRPAQPVSTGQGPVEP